MDLIGRWYAWRFVLATRFSLACRGRSVGGGGGCDHIGVVRGRDPSSSRGHVLGIGVLLLL